VTRASWVSQAEVRLRDRTKPRGPSGVIIQPDTHHQAPQFPSDCCQAPFTTVGVISTQQASDTRDGGRVRDVWGKTLRRPFTSNTGGYVVTSRRDESALRAVIRSLVRHTLR
jgi:hypothetical protein